MLLDDRLKRIQSRYRRKVWLTTYGKDQENQGEPRKTKEN